jgi:hypothetical protein
VEQKRSVNDDAAKTFSGADFLQAFTQWMDEFKPDAFVTINLPKARSAPRAESVYLNSCTRRAERTVLGGRTLKQSGYDGRIVWLLRREVSPDGLIHYHGLARFPIGRTWRTECATEVQHVEARCESLGSALRLASDGTPEPFTPTGSCLSNADIDVRPFERKHVNYMLKGQHKKFVPDYKHSWAVDDALRDHDLVILPELSKKRGRLNADIRAGARPLDWFSRDGRRTSSTEARRTVGAADPDGNAPEARGETPDGFRNNRTCVVTGQNALVRSSSRDAARASNHSAGCVSPPKHIL